MVFVVWILLAAWCSGPAATLDLSAWAPTCRIVLGA